ncbi:tripartite tricarboxylate transporter permease [Cuneatibacter sp. NSJ-177]|uniref:tripartite tricarboxylate transporter permease n=1 Tax=Cuneatibacter sp. NSJ-177 TaxID=2931401 RepID=UPI001FD2152A|nr:tripartite tricarboxylate transporter permease [Cuneatibacter sp. NSJ-177]MCJ7833927.1 tripartite tricarboxylate transporter permease [Cuneatibacter sp. NSJ-177]
MLDNIVAALGNMVSLEMFLCMFAGVAVGIVVGALPGLSATLAVALMLPFTFGMSPTAGILILVGAYCGGVYGGSITAILIRTPGTPASVATVADGYAMTKKGKAYEALMGSLLTSTIGGLLSGLALLLIAPLIAKLAVNFGPPEYFALAMFGLTIIASVSGKSLAKGMMMAGLGLLFACVGIDPYEGQARFIFGQSFLYSGVGMVPAMIGVFAIAEVFNQIEIRIKSVAAEFGDVSVDCKQKFPLKKLRPHLPNILRSSVTGIIVGAIPGTGGAIASFLAYNNEKAKSKHPEEFGNGSMDGIIAAETAKNATTGATLIPMFTLGIPGDTVTAILLGALTIHGLSTGPKLFTEHGVLVYTVIIGFFLVNLIMLVQGRFAIRWFSKITQVPSSILLPIILVLCLVGAYASNNSFASVGIAVFFGVLGFILGKFGFPMALLLIAMVLAQLTEMSLRQSLILSDGSPLIFVQRPICLIFLLLAVFSVCIPMLKARRARKAGKSS